MAEELCEQISQDKENGLVVRQIGIFPNVIEANYQPPGETEQVKTAIRQLWWARQTGILTILGQNGIGKSTLMSRLMYDESFLSTLPGLEAIFWLNGGFDDKAENFLKSIRELFEESKLLTFDGPRDDTSFTRFIANLGEQKLRYLLIIDDVSNRKLAEFAGRLQTVIRCVLISTDAEKLGVSEGDDFVWKSITIEPNDSHIERLFRTSYRLPTELLDEREKMSRLLKLSYGLPLIANIIHKKFAKIGSDKINHRQLVENIYEKLEKSLAKVEVSSLKVTIFDLFKKRFEKLDEKTRRRYYAFLLLDPGEAFHVDLLAYIWEMDDVNLTIPGAIVECDRFIDIGLARKVEMDVADVKKAEQFRQGYAINGFLHKLALDDAISQESFATDLRDLRVKLVKETAPATSGKEDNILLLASKLGDWDLFKIVAENVETSTLMALTTISSENNAGGNVLKVLNLGMGADERCYETSWRCTHTFLSILNRLLTCGFEMQITKAVIDGEGVDFTKRDSAGMTLLMHACLRGYLPVIEWLLRRRMTLKFDLDDKDNDGTTAVMFASKWGHLEVVKWLSDHGANLILEDKDGTTAIMYAAKWGHLNVVEWLHGKLGGDSCNLVDTILEAHNKNGETAMMLASWKGHLDIVKWLHSKGVDLTAKNADGQTALSLAIDAASRSTFLREERQQIIDFLKKDVAK